MKLFAISIQKDKLDSDLYKSLLSVVDKNKSERLVKFVFQEDIQRGLFADLLVRKVLMEEFNLKNEEIHFSTDEYGKPYCEFINDFHFNVSHSGDWVVCAVDNKPIGIDIEEISKIDLDISKNFFSDKEHGDLLLSNDPYDYFFTLWSLKESYIKFIGKGLSHSLNSFSMRLVDGNFFIESDNQILDNVYFKQYTIDAGYKMAVCSLNPNIPEKIQLYSKKDIVNVFLDKKVDSGFARTVETNF